MSKFGKDLLESAQELKRLRVLTCCAVLGALAMALEGTTTIDLGPYISIGWTWIPNVLVDMLFGPVTGALFAGVMDVLKYMIHPSGPFHFGFTFDAMLAAFIYGCLLYKRPVDFWRIFTSKGMVAVLVNILIATYWISSLYGKGFLALLPGRVISNLAMWPINSVIFFVIAGAMERGGVFKLLKR